MILTYFDDDKENRSILKLESMPCYLLSIHNAKTFSRIIGNSEQNQGPVLSFKTILRALKLFLVVCWYNQL